MEKDELITKLFDQVKESSDKTDHKIEDLTNAVKGLTTTASSPSHSDIKACVDRLIEGMNSFDKSNIMPFKNIQECKDGMDYLKIQVASLINKVRIMIITVSVAFALLAVSYIFVSNSISNMVSEQIDNSKKEEIINGAIRHQILDLLKEMGYEVEKSPIKK